MTTQTFCLTFSAAQILDCSFQKQVSFLYFQSTGKTVFTNNHVSAKIKMNPGNKTSMYRCVSSDWKGRIILLCRPLFPTMATRSLPAYSEVYITFLVTSNIRCSNVVPLAKINFGRQLAERNTSHPQGLYQSWE